MTNLGFTHTNSANTNLESEHASVAASGASDGTLTASDAGASYAGSAGGDVSYSVTPPALPETPDAAAEVTATAEAAVGDATARAEATLEGATGDLPVDAPDLGGSLEGGLEGGLGAAADGSTVALDAMLSGWLDALGSLVAQFSGSLSALVGF